LEEWADFARGRAVAEFMTKMQGHLDEGCAPCAEVLGIWTTTLRVASRERDFEAPASGVRFAKALYGIAQPEKRDSVPLLFARLVFSSFAEPLREGVRGAGSSSSHFLFEEGNWLLDLHVKPLAEGDLISVAGQIFDRVHADRVYEGGAVAVLREKKELARTTTNEFGEFQLEFSQGDDLIITVDLQGECVLATSLPRGRVAF
jgi:hypothetical protein